MRITEDDTHTWSKRFPWGKASLPCLKESWMGVFTPIGMSVSLMYMYLLIYPPASVKTLGSPRFPTSSLILQHILYMQVWAIIWGWTSVTQCNSQTVHYISKSQHDPRKSFNSYLTRFSKIKTLKKLEDADLFKRDDSRPIPFFTWATDHSHYTYNYIHTLKADRLRRNRFPGFTSRCVSAIHRILWDKLNVLSV